jgi:hypothetical protein
MGTIGSRYSIVISNPTSERVEAVISVDGLDAMDGHPANYVEKRGYVLQAYGDMTVDGFRTSMDEVATFRFSSVGDSYAGRLGEARDVGVIGVAFFAEKVPEYVYQPPARPSPHPINRAPARKSAAPPAPPASPPAAGNPPATSPSDIARGGAESQRIAPAEDRPGLGTEFGEARESRIGSTSFERASLSSPTQVVAFRYNDRAGLVALGIVIQPTYATDDQRTRETAEPFRQNRFAQAPPPRY